MTTGAPLTIEFANTDTHSQDYATVARHYRPSHADLVAYHRFNRFNDPRGGGHFSARLTVAFVAAGVVAKKMLSRRASPSTRASREIGGCDRPCALRRRYCARRRPTWIRSAESSNAAYRGVPLGLGQPLLRFGRKPDRPPVVRHPGRQGGRIRQAASPGRVCAVRRTTTRCSTSKGTTATNNAGGINGGITNGNEIVVRAAVKPTPSIGREQNTYNLATDKVEPLTIRGRHDVCVALRRAVVAEAAVVAIALANLIPALMSVPETSAPYARSRRVRPGGHHPPPGSSTSSHSPSPGLYDAREGAEHRPGPPLAESSGLTLSALLTRPRRTDGSRRVQRRWPHNSPPAVPCAIRGGAHRRFYGHRFMPLREGVLIPAPKPRSWSPGWYTTNAGPVPCST
ncbi:MAG: chorismate synthase [Alistipes onderdonkii]